MIAWLTRRRRRIAELERKVADLEGRLRSAYEVEAVICGCGRPALHYKVGPFGIPMTACVCVPDGQFVFINGPDRAERVAEARP